MRPERVLTLLVRQIWYTRDAMARRIRRKTRDAKPSNTSKALYAPSESLAKDAAQYDWSVTTNWPAYRTSCQLGNALPDISSSYAKGLAIGGGSIIDVTGKSPLKGIAKVYGGGEIMRTFEADRDRLMCDYYKAADRLKLDPKYAAIVRYGRDDDE